MDGNEQNDGRAPVEGTAEPRRARVGRPFGIVGTAVALIMLVIVACDQTPETIGGGGSDDPDTGGEDPDGATSEYSRLAGGAATVFVTSNQAFRTRIANLTAGQQQDFNRGENEFRVRWVPAGRPGRDGLGPAFIADACEACHTNAGRGAPPVLGQSPTDLLFRLSDGPLASDGSPTDLAGFGTQLQNRAINGFLPEADVSVQYTAVNGQYGDGTPYTLMQPIYTFQNPYVPISASVQVSPRIAPAVFGLGLLEAIDAATIESLADPNDVDGDGISGRVQRVPNDAGAGTVLGRFGWKGEAPDLLHQNAGAFAFDMGITNPLITREVFAGQSGQDDGRADDPELNQRDLNAVTLYTQSLGVPARRDINDPIVLAGESHFRDLGCASCHTPTHVTGSQHPLTQLRGQTIHAFTDLLLHDMGDGLADDRPIFEASGREWKTPPLWGLGLQRTVNGHQRLLHDGRARNIAEAILWHGGEAEASKEAFRLLPLADRNALIAFLESN